MASSARERLSSNNSISNGAVTSRRVVAQSQGASASTNGNSLQNMSAGSTHSINASNSLSNTSGTMQTLAQGSNGSSIASNTSNGSSLSSGNGSGYPFVGISLQLQSQGPTLIISSQVSASGEDKPNMLILGPARLCFCLVFIVSTLFIMSSFYSVTLLPEKDDMQSSMVLSNTNNDALLIPERDLLVAILADSALNKASQKVLQLMKDEDVDLVLHAGDLDYTGNTTAFEEQLNHAGFGMNFPFLFTPGNYEGSAFHTKGAPPPWPQYAKARMKRISKLADLGLMTCPYNEERCIACIYHPPNKSPGYVNGPISFVMSAIGTDENMLKDDLRELLTAQRALWGTHGTSRARTWRFCSWHLPLTDMQLGFREGVWWMNSKELAAAYESCRRWGAIILTGHEHYYLRTHLLTGPITTNGVESFVQTSRSRSFRGVSHPMLNIGRNSTFAVVCGLGGHSVSVPSAGYFRARKHLAMVHPLRLLSEVDPGGKIFYPAITGRPPSTSVKLNGTKGPGEGYPFGAFFCSLSRIPMKASSKSELPSGECYFKTIDGEVHDRFSLSLVNVSPMQKGQGDGNDQSSSSNDQSIDGL